MAKVMIMFSGDLRQVGKTRTVTDEDAVTMVREGRAVYVADPPPEPEPTAPAEPQAAPAAPAPEPAPAAEPAPVKAAKP